MFEQNISCQGSVHKQRHPMPSFEPRAWPTGTARTQCSLIMDIWKHDREGKRVNFSLVLGPSTERPDIISSFSAGVPLQCLKHLLVWAKAIYGVAAGREENIARAADSLAVVTKQMHCGSCLDTVAIHTQKKINKKLCTIHLDSFLPKIASSILMLYE